MRPPGGASVAQKENDPSQPQSDRYYREYIRLPDDEGAADEIFRRFFYERTSRGWQLISASKESSGDALLLEWDTLESSSK